MLAGIFDNWHEQYKTLGPKGRFKDYMFINELVLLWPFVCSSSLFKILYIDGEFDLVFKGSAAQSFCDLVKALGFNPNIYPFFDEGDRTLRWWIGPVYEYCYCRLQVKESSEFIVCSSIFQWSFT